MKNQSIYLTENEKVCKRSITPRPKKVNLHIRQPFTVGEIAQICLYALSILIGTFGNTLVMKYFSFGEVSVRAGSRFVVVLAAIDTVSSLWVPILYIIINLLYWYELKKLQV